MTLKNSVTQQTQFWYQLKSFGIKKVIFSLDFKIAFLVLVLLILNKKYSWNIFISDSTSYTQYVTAIFAASSVLFALTITSLSIIVSFSSSRFVNFLRKKNKLNDVLFHFWLGNATYLISIVFSMIYFLLGTKLLCIQDWLFFISVSIFVYAIGITFYLLATIIRFGYFLSYFESEINETKE